MSLVWHVHMITCHFDPTFLGSYLAWNFFNKFLEYFPILTCAYSSVGRVHPFFAWSMTLSFLMRSLPECVNFFLAPTSNSSFRYFFHKFFSSQLVTSTPHSCVKTSREVFPTLFGMHLLVVWHVSTPQQAKFILPLLDTWPSPCLMRSTPKVCQFIRFYFYFKNIGFIVNLLSCSFTCHYMIYIACWSPH